MSEWPRKSDESHVERWPSQWMLRNAVGEISYLGDGPVKSLEARYDQALYVPASELEREQAEVERARKHHADDMAVAAKRIEGLEQELEQVRKRGQESEHAAVRLEREVAVLREMAESRRVDRRLAMGDANREQDRAASRTQQLNQVREEVEKAEKKAQLGNGGELEDPLANIKAILDSSPSLSGGGESSAIGPVGTPVPGDPQNVAYNLPEWLEIYAEWIESGDPIEDTNRQLMAITLRAARRVVESTPPFSTQQSSTTGNSLSGEPGDRGELGLLDAALTLERLAEEHPVGFTRSDMLREAAAVRRAVHTQPKDTHLSGDRKPIIEPGEEFEAATKVIGPEINDPVGYAAAELLHRVLDAVEAVRYRDVKPRPIVDRPEA